MLLKEFVVLALAGEIRLPVVLIDLVWEYYSLERVRLFHVSEQLGIQLIEKHPFEPPRVGDALEIRNSDTGRRLQYNLNTAMIPSTRNGMAIVCTHFDGFIYYPDLLSNHSAGVIHGLYLEDPGYSIVGWWAIASKLFELWQTVGLEWKYSIFDANTYTREFYDIPEGAQDTGQYYKTLVEQARSSVVVGGSIYWNCRLGLNRLTVDGNAVDLVRFPRPSHYPGCLPKHSRPIWNPKTQRIYFITRHPGPGFYWDLSKRQWGGMAPGNTINYYSSLRILVDGGISIDNAVVDGQTEYYNPDTDTWTAHHPKVP